MNFHDVELLSEYLDGRLKPPESTKLESRLASNPDLQKALDDLRLARGLLRQLPQRRTPRNFTLTPKMAGIKAPVPRAYPAFRLATVLAALLFLITFAVNGIVPFGASHLSAAQAPAAQAPAYGLGGGSGGGCDNCGTSESTPGISPAPLQPFSAVAPTVEAQSAPQDNTINLGSPTPEISPKAAAPLQTSIPRNPIPTEAPIPLTWQIFIGIVALICAATAWILRTRSEQEFHKRWNTK